MKLAIAGKGGVGKTTLAAALARRAAGAGRRVIAVDADPAGGLASALGLPEDKLPEPIAGMRSLVEERTGARGEGPGLVFRLNPDVEDIPDRFSADADGVRVLVLGTVNRGGRGCMCPEGALLKALMQHVLLRIEDDVILDMEAGFEHIGRASAAGVDAMLTVVEPGMRSVEVARRIGKLARDIGVTRTPVVLNKVSGPDEEETLRRALKGRTVLGVLPYSEELARADLEGRSGESLGGEFAAAVERVWLALEAMLVREKRSSV